MIVSGTYDPALVGLSILVAILASYAALDLAGRLPFVTGPARAFWLVAAAVAAGGAIWSMHFVGMLAFKMPMPVNYDLGVTLASLALPILVTGIGLSIVARDRLTPAHLAVGGLTMGLGIVSMHYLGMAGMEMAAVITYDRLLVAASILIAVGASTAALWLVAERRSIEQTVVAACAMGAAIAGMHYTGMAAATFTMAPALPTPEAPVLAPTPLAVAIAATTLVILVLALAGSQMEKRLVVREADRRLADIATHFPGLIYRREMDPQGRIAYSYIGGASEHWPQFPSTTRSNRLAREKVWTALAPEEPERWWTALHASATALTPFFFEGAMRAADGSVRWARSQASTRRRADGTVVWDGLLLDVTEAKEAEDKLKASLTEKEALIAEIHHRVRNNLQVIISLMHLETMGATDAGARERVARITDRIGALGRIHDQLHRFGNSGRIDVGRYLKDLCADLGDLYTRVGGLTVDIEAAPLTCDLETAVPLGLIANELIANSLRHAFPAGREGCVTVRMGRSDGAVQLTVSDNGVGVGEMEPNGLGQRMIRALARQVEGELRCSGDGGGTIILTLSGDRFQDASAAEPPAA